VPLSSLRIVPWELEVFIMKRISAIVLVFLLSALIILPTIGQPNQSASHSYSIKSVRTNYTIGITAPSHQPAVVVSGTPYSTLKYGALFQPEAKGIGETAKSNVIGLSTPSDVAIQARTNTPAVPRAEPKFSIQGTVYGDQNGNLKMDYNETGLANWTINLEQPPGNAISKATTNKGGRYGFYSLVPGEYTVVENLEMGWNLTTPSGGKYAINLTSNTTMLNFGNKMMPTPTRNITSPPNTTFFANGTMPVNATSPK
jgi:hypothetical protein